jgi:hypothetical protein
VLRQALREREVRRGKRGKVRFRRCDEADQLCHQRRQARGGEPRDRVRASADVSERTGMQEPLLAQRPPLGDLRTDQHSRRFRGDRRDDARLGPGQVQLRLGHAQRARDGADHAAHGVVPLHQRTSPAHLGRKRLRELGHGRREQLTRQSLVARRVHCRIVGDAG